MKKAPPGALCSYPAMCAQRPLLAAPPVAAPVPRLVPLPMPPAPTPPVPPTLEPTAAPPTGRLSTFGPLRSAFTPAPAPASTAPPTVAGVLPVIAGVLLIVDGALMDGVLITGAAGTMGAAGVLLRTGGAVPTDAGAPSAGVGLVIVDVALPGVTDVAPVTDGDVVTGDGVLPLTDGAPIETPPAGALPVWARAGSASIAAAAMTHVRIDMRISLANVKEWKCMVMQYECQTCSVAAV